MTGPGAPGRARGALVLAPFWGAEAHVGVYRVERFVRWLSNRDIPVTVVRAGGRDAISATDWGRVIAVRDPVGFYRDTAFGGGPPPRRRSPLRRAVATTVLSPDPGAVWARHAARHPDVLAAAVGARWVVSSSPPESTHLSALRLAQRSGASLIADLRDGWLDEPNRPILRYSPLHRMYEGWWERRVLSRARVVFVTSTVWRDLLVRRFPGLSGVVTVLPNGYPRAMPVPAGRPTTGAEGDLLLIHSGRFTASRGLQTVERLLRPLLAGVQRSAARGVVRLLGDLTPRDRAEVDALAAAFATEGWKVEVASRVDRHTALAQLQQASGLLLLAVSRAAIPSKLFEYLAAGRPVLAVTPADGAVWQACEDVALVTRVDVNRPETYGAAVETFLAACERGGGGPLPPPRFGEPALERVFATALGFEP